MRSYAIGDVHGHLDKLLAAHALVAADRAATGDTGAPLVHLGDYVDRGPDVPGCWTIWPPGWHAARTGCCSRAITTG